MTEQCAYYFKKNGSSTVLLWKFLVPRRGEKHANFSGFFSVFLFFPTSDFFNKWWVPHLYVIP
jgi:hypothetical protein